MLTRLKQIARSVMAPVPEPVSEPEPVVEAPTKSTRIEDYPRDLHLGCGGRRAPGFCNVDITDQSTVDIIDNVATLERFPDDYATSIYACHVLEHFSHTEAPEVLKTWFRVLAPGGTIRISVPDIDRIVKIYAKNWKHFQTDGHSPWIGLLYGGQTDQYDYHKTGWNFCWMAHIMRGIGYVDMQEYPHEPHFIGGEFWDNSLAHEPFGEFLSLNMLARKPFDTKAAKAVRAAPCNVRAWLSLIAEAQEAGRLSSHAAKLVAAHELTPTGHAVNAFAEEIASRGAARFEAFARKPARNVEAAIEEIVKWKTALQCGHSHDVSKGYFVDAEPYMEKQWNEIIFPLIRDLNFANVLDLACGHGRNSEFLRRHSKAIALVDINASCIEACRKRFGAEAEGTRFSYHVTDGNHLRMIPDGSITLVYSWDSMVHFDKLIVRDYVQDIARVLARGGSAFLHHSNYGATAPDSDWAQNPGTRSDMSAELMRSYAAAFGLDVVAQHIQGRKEGWGMDGLDCASILRKPAA